MKEDIKKKMEALLSAYSTKKKPQAPPRKTGDEPEMIEFRQRFRQLATEVIVPAFRDAADLLKRHGHDCELDQRKATESATGEEIFLSVTLRIYPAGYGRTFFQDSEPPYVCVMPDEANKQVKVLAGRSLPEKPRKPTERILPPDQLNADVVMEEVLAVLQDVLATD